MKDTREQAEHDYDVQLGALVQQLHHVAEEIRRREEYRIDQGEDRVQCARGIQTSLLQRFALDRGPLQKLLDCAIRAEHPTARATPAELLDQAITALQEPTASLLRRAAEAIDDVLDLAPHGKLSRVHAPEVLAEAALRGAGVIR